MALVRYFVTEKNVAAKESIHRYSFTQQQVAGECELNEWGLSADFWLCQLSLPDPVQATLHRAVTRV